MNKPVMASVIIPCYNQASRLALTLESFRYQQLDADWRFEVVVVDDGSSDETPAVIEQYQRQLPLTGIWQANKGRAAARNAGLQASSGNVLLFTDADRPVSNTWIQDHLNLQFSRPLAIGVGEIREFYFSNLEARVPALREAMASNYQPMRRLSRPYSYWEFIRQSVDNQGKSLLNAPWTMTLIGNLSVSRSLVEAAGMFDEGFTGWGFEHFELGYRLHKVGASFWRVDGAVNYHLAHGRPASFYANQIRESLAHFLTLHSDRAVEALLPLLLGEISLGEYDLLAGGGATRLPEAVRALKYTAPFS